MGKEFTMMTGSSLTANESLDQQEIGWRGGSVGAGIPYARMYNLQALERVTGEVVSVEMITPIKVMSFGVHLILQTDTETIPIHLGMGWFIENQDLNIAPRDSIEIIGSRITFEDKPAIIAAEVRKDDEVLTLRDTTGFPVWSGWRNKEYS